MPLCDLNTTDARRFYCVDPSGFLPLPRDNPLTTECLAECLCANGTQYGACAHHDVPPAGVPQFGTPWCTVVTANCLDSQNAKPIPSGLGDGFHRGSCVPANTFISSKHSLVQTPVSRTGVPDWQEIDLDVYASREVLIRPLVAPTANGTKALGTLIDLFIDYEACYFNPAVSTVSCVLCTVYCVLCIVYCALCTPKDAIHSLPPQRTQFTSTALTVLHKQVVPSTVDQEWACELLLAPRTSAASTIGASMLEFPLGNVSYGVLVNRKTFVRSVRLRSDNLNMFHVFFYTTGGQSAGETIPGPGGGLVVVGRGWQVYLLTLTTRSVC